MPWNGRDRCYLRNTRAATMFSIVADTPLSGVQNARRAPKSALSTSSIKCRRAL
jgi:hypothetical protein